MPRNGDRQRLESGVPGLDTVLCGGLRRGSVSIIQGSPGAGKTILASQICFSHVRQGGRCIYLTLLAESHDQLMMNLRTLSFYDEQRVSESIFYISAFSAMQSEGLKGLLQLMSREREQRSASLVVFDGTFAVEEATGSALEFRRALNELGTMASITRTTILLLTNSPRGTGHPEYTAVDGWIELGQDQVDYRSYRYLQVRKSRGSDALSGRHQALISEHGFEVFPRLESARGSARRRQRRERLSTGIGELDGMLDGGIDAGAMCVVAGSTGVGKTSFGLHFLGQSSPTEPALMFGFYEAEHELTEKAASLGIDLAGLIRSGAVEVLWFPPVEALVDELAYKLLQAVRRRQVTRLVVDGMEAFRQSALYPERLGRFFSALTNELSGAGVTTLFTLELPSGIDLPSRLSPVSAIAEYIVILEYAELASQVRRTVTIRKSRRSHFDPRIREFVIGERGVSIGGMLNE